MKGQICNGKFFLFFNSIISLLLTTFHYYWSVNCQQLLWTTHDNDRQRTTTRRVDNGRWMMQWRVRTTSQIWPKTRSFGRVWAVGMFFWYFGFDYNLLTTFLGTIRLTTTTHWHWSSHSCHTTTDDATRKPPPPRHTTRAQPVNGYTTSGQAHEDHGESTGRNRTRTSRRVHEYTTSQWVQWKSASTRSPRHVKRHVLGCWYVFF